MFIFTFSNNNLSKYQWIFAKLAIVIDIVEIWLGITIGQILSIFDRVICPPTHGILFQDNNLSKSERSFTKLNMCIQILWRSDLGLLLDIFHQFLTVFSP